MRFLTFISSVFLLFYCVLLSGCKEPIIEKPDLSRFTKKLITDNLDEPMQFEILSDGRILFVERKGKIKVFDLIDNKTIIIADLKVSIGYYSEEGDEISSTGEDGLFGAILDPNFDKNHWIYVFYSPSGGKHRSLVSRFDWIGDTLALSSEKILLEIPNQRISCCHLGGGLLFDPNGNLYISTGDNTPNDTRGYNPIDNQIGRSRYDAQRTSGNTNDLRGKILRIHPEPDGSYSIPEGNLFPKETLNTRPEIYTMGNRNPWRISLDSKTGFIYWGEVGPNGIKDSVGFGPKSYDEFNVAKKPGNFGWPYFIGPNKNYWNFDYSTNTIGEAFDPINPINNSPNNSGISELPKPVPAMIWYPQTKSDEFPLLGSGSNSAVGGPIFRKQDFSEPLRLFPEYFEGKWFITDWTRGWIMVVTLDDKGDFKSMEQFIPDLKLSGPIDMKFGPNGDLYILEYGRGPYKLNPEASLSRIEFHSGNRAPIVKISSNKIAGANPLTLNLSSEGTMDLDKDPLKFDWEIKFGSEVIQNSKEANPQIILKLPGRYIVSLKVSDSHGAVSKSDDLEIVVGNDPPVVKIDFINSNSSFFFIGDTLDYIIKVVDTEDGNIDNDEIDLSKIYFNIEPVDVEIEGFNNIIKQLKRLNARIPFKSVVAENIINKSDCKSCHSENERLIGPSYNQISEKYFSGDKDYLTDKILRGGSGVWDSKMAMSAHPDLNETQAGMILDYIIDLKKLKTNKTLPVKGRHIFKNLIDNDFKKKNLFVGLNNQKFVFRASYLDNGFNDAPELLGTDVIVLRNPIVPVTNFDVFKNVELNHQITISRSSVIPEKTNSYIGLNDIDFTGIRELKFNLSILPESKGINFGHIEIRINSFEGQVLGDFKLVREGENGLLKYNNMKIKNIDGIHDLYVVFKMSNESSEINNIELRSLEFIK